MSHQQPNQPNHNQDASTEQESVRLERLLNLLWDGTKPEGEEAVPEEQWEEILAGPCQNDKSLIQHVCALERDIRLGMEIDANSYVSPDGDFKGYIEFAMTKKPLLRLLWNQELDYWYPETDWDKLLESADEKDRMSAKAHVRRLKGLEGAPPMLWSSKSGLIKKKS